MLHLGGSISNPELWARGVCHHHGDIVVSRGQEEFPRGRAGKQIVMGCLTVKGLELNSPPSIAGLQLSTRETFIKVQLRMHLTFLNAPRAAVHSGGSWRSQSRADAEPSGLAGVLIRSDGVQHWDLSVWTNATEVTVVCPPVLSSCGSRVE